MLEYEVLASGISELPDFSPWKPDLITNVSRVQAFARCPTKYVYTYERNWDGLPNQNLELGTYIHEYVYRVQSGLPRPEPHPVIDPEWLVWAARVLPLYLENIPTWEWTDDLETPCYLVLSCDMGELQPDRFVLVLIGRFDGVTRADGYSWHLQHKTVSPRVTLADYVAEIAESYHESVYGEAIARHRPSYRGTILNCFVKEPLPGDPPARLNSLGRPIGRLAERTAKWQSKVANWESSVLHRFDLHLPETRRRRVISALVADAYLLYLVRLGRMPATRMIRSNAIACKTFNRPCRFYDFCKTGNEPFPDSFPTRAPDYVDSLSPEPQRA